MCTNRSNFTLQTTTHFPPYHETRPRVDLSFLRSFTPNLFDLVHVPIYRSLLDNSEVKLELIIRVLDRSLASKFSRRRLTKSYTRPSAQTEPSLSHRVATRATTPKPMITAAHHHTPLKFCTACFPSPLIVPDIGLPRSPPNAATRYARPRRTPISALSGERSVMVGPGMIITPPERKP